ncbi:unnamed protein product [Ectocarpus sp. CCAP 1310/34]|nr:unnamed protein product [Ectocarpus sp. CCAP 1310/34]
MSSTADDDRTGTSGDQTSMPGQEGSDAEFARSQQQVSRLGTLVEEAMEKKGPGNVVVDEASRGGWAAAPADQDEPLQPHGGGGAVLQQGATSGQGPRQLLEGSWASRSGANPAGPDGVGPGVRPDREDAMGFNFPDKATVNKCMIVKEILSELEKIYDPGSQGSKHALMNKMFRFTIPAHSNSNPIEDLYTLELLYSRLREKGLNADGPFFLPHFVAVFPPEYQQVKFVLETATTMNRDEIVRIASMAHSNLPEERKASKGKRKTEHAFLASDGSSGGGAPGRGNRGRRKGSGGGRGGSNQKGRGGGAKAGGGKSGGGGGGGAGSMRGRCFRCGELCLPARRASLCDVRSAWATDTTRQVRVRGGGARGALAGGGGVCGHYGTGRGGRGAGGG